LSGRTPKTTELHTRAPPNISWFAILQQTPQEKEGNLPHDFPKFSLKVKFSSWPLVLLLVWYFMF
jgi:hypothetical protein